MRYLFKVRGVLGGKKKRDIPPETQSSRRIPSKFCPDVSTPAVGTLACDIIKCQHNLAALSLNLTRTTMSDKFREFIEIPQQFVRDGNQVCFFSHSSISTAFSVFTPQFLTRCTKPSDKGAKISQLVFSLEIHRFE